MKNKQLLMMSLALMLLFSIVAGIRCFSFASADSISTFPLLSMPKEYINYTICRVNGSLWAKIDGTYPLNIVFGPEETFELGGSLFRVVYDKLPMVYPTPPGTTGISVKMNETELEWSNYTATYPEALHHTAIGDWSMINCTIRNVTDYFVLKIHYEHPIEVINGSYTFLYDLNISPYLSPWSTNSTAYFNIRMETDYKDLKIYRTGSEHWTLVDYTATQEDAEKTVSVKIFSEYQKALLGDLAVTFTEPKQTGFLGSGLPMEYGYGIIAIGAVAAITVVGYAFSKRKSWSRRNE